MTKINSKNESNQRRRITNTERELHNHTKSSKIEDKKVTKAYFQK